MSPHHLTRIRWRCGAQYPILYDSRTRDRYRLMQANTRRALLRLHMGGKVMRCVECNNDRGSRRTMGMCVLCYDRQAEWLWVLSEESEEVK